MPPTHTMPELDFPSEAPASAVEQAECLGNAAKLVEDFAQNCAPLALDALLAAAEAATPGEAAALARAAADEASERAETLIGEVARFLSLTRSRPSNAG